MKELLRFEITGTIPSKKNEHEIRVDYKKLTKRGRPKMWIAPSDLYQSWERGHAAELQDMFPEFRKLKGPLAIDYIFHPATRHPFDASNKMESINDMLVESEILYDDNIFILVDLHPYLGEMSTTGELMVEVIIYDKS